MQAATQLPWQDCLVKGNMLVLSIARASDEYKQLQVLGLEAQSHGIPCVAAAVVPSLRMSSSSLIRQLPVPGGLACHRYTTTLKISAVAYLLAHEISTLFVEPSWSLASSPIQFLQRSNFEVVGYPDTTMLDSALFWIRASSATANVANRAANRSAVAQDYHVLNEEIASRSAGLRCCLSTQLGTRYFSRRPGWWKPRPSAPGCPTIQANALGPPDPPFRWRGEWKPNSPNTYESGPEGNSVGGAAYPLCPVEMFKSARQLDGRKLAAHERLHGGPHAFNITQALKRRRIRHHVGYRKKVHLHGKHFRVVSRNPGTDDGRAIDAAISLRPSLKPGADPATATKADLKNIFLHSNHRTQREKSELQPKSDWSR